MSQIFYLPSGKLNNVNDASVGGGTNAGVFETGLLGRQIDLNTREAAALSNTTVGTLRAGKYQYVQFKAGSTAQPAIGVPVVWDDTANFVVTPDFDATAIGKFAGIGLNTVTKGNYGWIQVDGEATVKCKATVTGTTTGQTAVLDQALTATVDSVADATADTQLLDKSRIGVFLEAPANGALKRVALKFQFNNYKE